MVCRQLWFGKADPRCRGRDPSPPPEAVYDEEEDGIDLSPGISGGGLVPEQGLGWAQAARGCGSSAAAGLEGGEGAGVGVASAWMEKRGGKGDTAVKVESKAEVNVPGVKAEVMHAGPGVEAGVEGERGGAGAGVELACKRRVPATLLAKDLNLRSVPATIRRAALPPAKRVAEASLLGRDAKRTEAGPAATASAASGPGPMMDLQCEVRSVEYTCAVPTCLP